MLLTLKYNKKKKEKKEKKKETKMDLAKNIIEHKYRKIVIKIK